MVVTTGAIRCAKLQSNRHQTYHIFNSRTYPWSILIVQVSTNFNFTNIRSDLKRIANISTCDGIRQTVFCIKYNSSFNKCIKTENDVKYFISYIYIYTYIPISAALADPGWAPGLAAPNTICDMTVMKILPLSVLTRLLGDRKGIRPVKMFRR